MYRADYATDEHDEQTGVCDVAYNVGKDVVGGDTPSEFERTGTSVEGHDEASEENPDGSRGIGIRTEELLQRVVWGVRE